MIIGARALRPSEGSSIGFLMRGRCREPDFKQRPLSYEYEAAMTGNPLISWERRSAPGTSTFSVDTAFFVLFGPDSGSYGSKMGAAAGTPR